MRPAQLKRIAALGLALLVAGCSDVYSAAGTGLFLQVTVPSGMGIDQLEVSASVGTTVTVSPTLVPATPRTLAAVETVRVVLPNSLAGQTVAVHVVGLASGSPVASGDATEVVVEGREVDVPVALTAGAGPLTITTALLPDGYVNQAYSFNLTVSGGKPPYLWSLATGDLPAGITLNATSGLLSGTTSSAGTAALTVRVTDDTGSSELQSLNLPILTLPVLPTATLSDGYLADVYNHPFVVTGGRAPYTFNVVAGTLPDGMALSTDGTLGGTPTTTTPEPAGATIAVQVLDANLKQASNIFTLHVYELPVLTAAVADGYVTQAYNVTVPATGGKLPVSFAVTTGALPDGLMLSTAGVLSGTPTAPGAATFTITLTDAGGKTAMRDFTFLTFDLPAFTTPTLLPTTYVGTPYAKTLVVTGGRPPIAFAITTGTAPVGLSLSSAGQLSGTPLIVSPLAGNPFTVTATDGNGRSAVQPFTFFAYDTPSVTTTSLPDGSRNQMYSATLNATGGKPPLNWSVSGNLPDGLVLGADGMLSGMPTTSGTANLVFIVTDAGGLTDQLSWPLSIYASLVISNSTPLPDAYQQISYAQSLTAAGGQQPYTFAITSGALPAGITRSGASLSGTPTAIGSSTFTIEVTDSSGPAQTATKNLTINVVGPPVLNSAGLPDGYLGQTYSQSFSGTGGKPPYQFAVTMGTLPAGITLDSGNGALSGAPSMAGTSPITVTLTDANSLTSSQNFSLVMLASLAITTASPLPDAYIGKALDITLANTGGKPAFTWTVLSGALPVGLTLQPNGHITGTPVSATSANFTVQLADGNNRLVTKAFALTVLTPPSIVTSSLSDGYVGTAYGTTVVGTNGRSPYTFAVTTGTLPTGLTLTAAGVLSGTPTAAQSPTFTVTLTDANSETATRNFTLPVFNAPSITTTTLADAYSAQAYTVTLAGSGGETPYTFAQSGGSLPTGISLSPAGELSGTTAATGTFNFDVTLTDANNVSAPRSLTLIVRAPLSISTTTLPDPYQGRVYSGALAAAGGRTPYTFTVSSGTLPTGVVLASDGTLAGTPTAAGTASVTFQVRDANNVTITKAITLTYLLQPTISTASIADAYRTSSYSATLAGTNGKTPYSFAVTTGMLPAGILLSSAGNFSGTPTAAGSQTFTVTLTDANAVTATRSYTLPVHDVLTVTTATLPDGYTGVAYTSTTLAASGGEAAYTWALAVGSTLPSGLSLSTAGVLTGTPTATGTPTFTVRVTDNNGITATRELAMVIYSPPTISTASPLIDAYANSAFNASLAGTGGKTPYSFAVTSGTLPTGVTLSGAGAFTGTPTVAGAYSFSVTITDANTRTGVKAFTMDVLSPLQITTATVPDGYSTIVYGQTLAVTGGRAAYTWNMVAGGTLPTGVTFSAGGVLSGTPSTNGTYSFTARVTDANMVSTTRAYTLQTYALPTITSPATLPAATTNSMYSYSLGGASGKTPYTWDLSAGSLPSGLTLSSGGVISGTTGASAGTSNFTVRLTDNNLRTVTQASSLTVQTGFTITTASLVDAYVTDTYSQVVATANGTMPYNWSWTSSTTGIPPGLSIGATTGTITGTPTVAVVPLASVT